MKYNQYISEVEQYPKKYNKYVKLAVKRHIADLKRNDIYFDEKAANRAIDFIEKLRHTKGELAGQKLILSLWQAFIVSQIFGWKNANGTRKYRYAYVEVARKNGKSTFAAGITLYMLLLDGEEGCECYTAATTRDQAKIVFEEAQRMVRKLRVDSKIIESLVGVQQHNINVLTTNSKLESLASDSDTLDGLNPHLTVIDEYHAHKNDDLYNVLKSGMGARKQPLQFVITTAGFDKAGPCFRLRESVINILNGKAVDDTQFGIIYTLDEDDDWNNPECWGKSNPNMDVSISLKFLQNEYNQAIINGSSQEVNFKTKNLNVWTDAAEVWINEQVWANNTHGIKEEELFGKICYGGLDLASGIDFNAFVLLFPNVRPNIHAIKMITWKPENKLVNNKEKKDYRDWKSAGLINTTPGDIIDWSFVSEDIKKMCGKYDMMSLSYDPYRANHGVIQELLAYGIVCHALAQTMKMLSEPTRQLETMATDGQFEHFGNPLLSWMMGQAEIIRDSKGNIMLTKADRSKKVDGVAALINAIAEWKTFEGDNSTDFFMFIEIDKK